MADPISDAQAWDESLEVDVGLLLNETVPSMSVVASPSEPARKTRVLSMSRVRSPVSFLVTKSPVRISRRWSPCGQPRVTGGVENVRTLRSIKRNLREKKGLDTESLQPFSFGDSEFLEPDSQLQLTAGCVENRVPPSLRDSQKWKGVQSLKDTSKHKKIAASQPSGVADFGDRCYPFHLNRSALPVLEVPPESVGRRHPYVTRALFQGPDVSLPTGVQVVGVYMECFADSEFDVSDSCFPEYVCCGLVSEFQDAVLQLEKVEVVVFSTGHILETFKSNCDFSEKFQFCSRHKKTSSQPSDVFYAGNTENPDLPAIDGSILSLVCGSNSDCDSDWSVHSEVLGAEESDSDWEVVQDEICSEDLPRLGLVEMDEEFSADPVAWQLADEYWTSATTNYSHETEFMGSCEEPVPDWFTGPYFDANASVMRPVDFLNQFLPQNLSRMVCRETNRYGVKKKGAGWSALAIGEFRAWLGISIYMALNRKPDRRWHWSTHRHPLFNNRCIQSVMSRKRWEEILNCLHLVDNEQVVSDKSDPKHNKIGKVQNFLDQLNVIFKQEKGVDSRLTLDEMTIHTGGRHCPVQQYSAAKPIKHHIKIFAVCSAGSKYCYNLKVYCGKNGDERTSVDSVVQDMVQFVPKQLNHHITMDNWFSSIPTFLTLLEVGILAIGTFRCNRVGWPESLRNKSDGVCRGDLSWRMHISRRIACCVWLDNHPFCLISTSSPPATEDCSVQRWCRSAGARVEVRTSPMLVEYQAFMRGVDIHDQMRAAYSTGMRTRKWWHRLWWFGIDTCLTNSYICYLHYERELAKRKKQGAVSDSETGSEVRYNHAEFLLEVADELVKRASRSGAEFQAHYGCDNAMHFSDKRRSRGLCCECRKLTRQCCPKCKEKAMCMGSCFLKHHSRKICCVDAGMRRRGNFRKLKLNLPRGSSRR